MSVFFLGVGIVVAVYFLIRNFVSGARCKSKAKLDGKTVIVTGSNTGIGRETAVDLARRGARVILACRSQSRGEAALAIVKRESSSSNVVFMQLDLASLKSVRSFAETFLNGSCEYQTNFSRGIRGCEYRAKRIWSCEYQTNFSLVLKTESRLDILINNAGVYMQGRTEDGLGLMFEVNHLGHFLLTHLLLDRLKECGPSRIVNVSSMGHNAGNLDFNFFSTHKEFGAGDSYMNVLKTYCNSKLCNVLFTHELAKRLQGTNVTCYSLHPGVIDTELPRHHTKTVRKLLRPIVVLFFKDAEAGAQTTLYCAVQEGIEGLSGRYFSDCSVKEVQPKARDDAVAKKLWELSEKLCDLS